METHTARSGPTTIPEENVEEGPPKSECAAEGGPSLEGEGGGGKAARQSDAGYDPSAMWIALSEYGEGNIFAIYPQLLAELFLQEEDARARGEGEGADLERLKLPSDPEWRLKQYFNLVSLQRAYNNDPDEMEKVKPEQATEEEEPWPTCQPGDRVIVPAASPERVAAPPPVAVTSPPSPEWDIAESHLPAPAQVVKAAQLLWKPPYPTTFEDEQEMRGVYSLIYDVFRYKTVLNKVLDDIHFFSDFPQHAPHRHAVWLFLMELARRRWTARARDASERAVRLLAAAGDDFRCIERDVWAKRVNFAAAVARIRIKNKAFSMADLLPPHLREEKVTACANKDLVTGWVNMFKAKNVNNLIRGLKSMGYTYSSSRQLCALEYRFDRVCPRFITLRPPPKTSIGQNGLVKEGIIILQGREFCEGASVLCRALRAGALRGHVAQTHATSPRSTAYLAGQLRELAAASAANQLAANPLAAAVPDIGRLYVFGAGDKAEQYVHSLREMGIEANIAPQFGGAVCVVVEPVYTECPLVSAALDGVVAALATPPNSYSAVTDPIDLVCGRGGDLAMLEILTESEIDKEGKERVASILEEQKKTLKFLMSKPQIQLVLYETHSALEAENDAMVRRAVSESNRLARERHSQMRRKHQQPHCNTEVVALTALTSAPPKHPSSAPGPAAPAQAGSGGSAQRGRPSVASKPPPATAAARPPSAAQALARPIPELALLPPEVYAERTPRDPDDDCADVFVPKCDLFELKRLPNLGNGLDINYILERDGCYLGLIQRKEITRLDAKYMIKVAEERGLFSIGAAAPASAASALGNAKRPRDGGSGRPRNRGGGFEVERIAAPTLASLSRNMRRRQSAGSDACTCPLADVVCCSRHERHQAAAAANAAFSCSCDARHKRRRSLEPTATSASAVKRAPPSPPQHRESPPPQHRASPPPPHGAPSPPPPPPSPPHHRASPPSPPPCREPFPVRVHQVRLRLAARVPHPAQIFV